MRYKKKGMEIKMFYKKLDLITEATKSNTVKEVCYVSRIFKQNVYTDSNGDLEVDDQEIDVNLHLDIPVHTFESFINALLELRKDFDVACAYSKEPLTHENSNKENIVADKSYTFTYWNSVHNNVLHSNNKQANVFIYLNEFERYANLIVY
ncbi:hypothetical protein [Lysinibacillus sphaericus]|uniref:Uncharacterized protein n=3 Tax=Lysinibacillus sphaericus TaxID=1421 RepID=A0A6H0A1G8_LYSSH|nr:hypothetical protein [Lysinibacillus sphaericus]ACA42403.1 hypothetical protein Bsph_p175 [Lysinibacillus sphaericus C3-41]AMO35360.1 hypothetical protein AR327_22995 [Lysinibacillus sphaericus]AMR93037.1 hypothetical protein A1T07_22790 [Lysinibacillus sphaericus]MBG9710617.1 hypothetical protein [Lysinibacillus sphaericus]MBG9730474.1 hypothetical protein [Lysinibacillus sphaericus]